MSIRKIQNIGGESAGITLPKETLKDLGIIEDGTLGEQYARVEHVEETDGAGEKFEIELLG